MGIMAVMPPEALANTRPPGIYGGNMDFNRLTVGAKLYLPIYQRGALFSTGDSHAVQGDGEINGTAIEASLSPVLEFVVHKGAGRAMKWPRAEDDANWYVMGMDVDLDAALEQAPKRPSPSLARERPVARGRVFAREHRRQLRDRGSRRPGADRLRGHPEEDLHPIQE